MTDCAYPPLIAPQNLPFMGNICVVVRTHPDNILANGNSVRRLMTCLEQMEYPHWTALFFSFQYEVSVNPITGIIAERNPLIRNKYSYIDKLDIPKPEDGDNGYLATDKAITFCPADSRWLLVTGSDYDYSPKTFSYLDPVVDAISLNFFIDLELQFKYAKYLEPQVDVFPHNTDKCTKKFPKCWWNKRQNGHTDLGSMIHSLDKWREEKILYSNFSPSLSQDGSVADDVRNRGWIMNSVPYCYASKASNAWSICRHTDP
jgi:hypothetical protein